MVAARSSVEVGAWKHRGAQSTMKAAMSTADDGYGAELRKAFSDGRVDR
nr:hypothetical protein Iba_chr11cCG9460 [Ipomoea batatas]